MNNISAPPRDPSPADDLASLCFRLHRVVSESPDLSLADYLNALCSIARATACIETLQRFKE